MIPMTCPSCFSTRCLVANSLTLCTAIALPIDVGEGGGPILRLAEEARQADGRTSRSSHEYLHFTIVERQHIEHDSNENEEDHRGE